MNTGDKSMKLPLDKNGKEIRAGDIIRLTFNLFQRERPGGRRVAIEGMSEREVIVPDEGGFLPPTVHWVDFLIEWSGACLIARRIGASDFSSFTSGTCVSISTGESISASSATHYLNSTFNGAEFEVINVR